MYTINTGNKRSLLGAVDSKREHFVRIKKILIMKTMISTGKLGRFIGYTQDCFEINRNTDIWAF